MDGRGRAWTGVDGRGRAWTSNPEPGTPPLRIVLTTYFGIVMGKVLGQGIGLGDNGYRFEVLRVGRVVEGFAPGPSRTLPTHMSLKQNLSRASTSEPVYTWTPLTYYILLVVRGTRISMNRARLGGNEGR